MNNQNHFSAEERSGESCDSNRPDSLESVSFEPGSENPADQTSISLSMVEEILKEFFTAEICSQYPLPSSSTSNSTPGSTSVTLRTSRGAKGKPPKKTSYSMVVVGLLGVVTSLVLLMTTFLGVEQFDSKSTANHNLSSRFARGSQQSSQTETGTELLPPAGAKEMPPVANNEQRNLKPSPTDVELPENKHLPETVPLLHRVRTLHQDSFIPPFDTILQELQIEIYGSGDENDTKKQPLPAEQSPDSDP